MNAARCRIMTATKSAAVVIYGGPMAGALPPWRATGMSEEWMTMR